MDAVTGLQNVVHSLQVVYLLVLIFVERQVHKCVGYRNVDVFHLLGFLIFNLDRLARLHGNSLERRPKRHFFAEA